MFLIFNLFVPQNYLLHLWLLCIAVILNTISRISEGEEDQFDQIPATAYDELYELFFCDLSKYNSSHYPDYYSFLGNFKLTHPY